MSSVSHSGSSLFELLNLNNSFFYNILLKKIY